MYPFRQTVSVGIALILGLSLGCASAGKGWRTVGKVFSPVTGTVKGAVGGLTSGAKEAGAAVAGDVRQYTTRIPGSKRTELTASQRRAIANYVRNKQYKERMRKYDIDSRLVPENIKVHVSY